MIFPIGDDQVHGGYKPLFSYAFIGLNVLVWLYQFSLGAGIQGFVTEYGSIPVEISQGEDLYTLLTSMFMHGGWMHLIGNMLFLWVFADNIEASIGNGMFVAFYIMGGLAAAITHIIFSLDSAVPMVGASGAISAVLGAYLVMYPRSRVKVLIFYFVKRFPAMFFLGFWILQQFLSLGQGSSDGGGVAWWAHIGGFAFGVIAGLFFKQAGNVGQLAQYE